VGDGDQMKKRPSKSGASLDATLERSMKRAFEIQY
jgi:hypothetical protein